MKNKFFSILLVSIIVIGLTGCGCSKSSKTYVLTCTYYEKAENEYEANTNRKEEFTYDGDNILKKLVTNTEYEYSSKERADRFKTVETNSAKRANSYPGVNATIDSVSDTKYSVNYEYDMEKVEPEIVFYSLDYIDEDNKFFVDKYVSFFEDTYKNMNGKCTVTEK